ncbi:high mobility group protein 20A [Armigeres subalbatus]|uniref:high mobility group protein 20A n=1 Tax=Armigeres subalbatus TaxID=124917 RepID=UPI002ED08D42
MDKQVGSEGTISTGGKPTKNGNGKDKSKAPQQQQQAPSASAASSKPIVKRKRKRVKDANAPKHPLTGYVRYMNEKRDAIRLKNPSLSAVEITKLLAEEWGTLSDEVKKPFLEAAEADRERYHREVTKYKQNNEVAPNNKKPKTNGSDSDLSKEVPYLNGREEKQREIRVGDYEIPIFTDDFLEHNKVIDSELRMLRKSNIDYEQQNSVLEKHVENMDNGIQKLENETNSLKTRNAVLQSYLLKLKSVLAGALAGLPIGSGKEGATVDNIDRYMSELHQMAKSSTHGHALNKAKDIIRKLDLQSLAT